MEAINRNTDNGRRLSGTGNEWSGQRENTIKSLPMEAHEELYLRVGSMIDLPAFLGQQGFQLGARQEPGRLSLVLRPTGETLWLERDVDRGGWTYTNAGEPHGRGTV